MPKFCLKISSLEFFKSYLVGRKQKVKINSITSEEMLITCGVPQGSILGLELISEFDSFL